MCPNLLTESFWKAEWSPGALTWENPWPTLPERLSDEPVEWGTQRGSPLVLTSVILNDSWNVATTEPSLLHQSLPRMQLSPSLMRAARQMLEEVGACPGPNPRMQRNWKRNFRTLRLPTLDLRFSLPWFFCLVISGTSSFKKKKKYRWILQVFFLYTLKQRRSPLDSKLGTNSCLGINWHP